MDNNTHKWTADLLHVSSYEIDYAALTVKIDVGFCEARSRCQRAANGHARFTREGKADDDAGELETQLRTFSFSCKADRDEAVRMALFMASAHDEDRAKHNDIVIFVNGVEIEDAEQLTADVPEEAESAQQ